jgi:di/tricarboxylate transporter
MVYGTGGYRFLDFTRVGLPLQVFFWLLATFLIPVLWPLSPGG